MSVNACKGPTCSPPPASAIVGEKTIVYDDAELGALIKRQVDPALYTCCWESRSTIPFTKKALEVFKEPRITILPGSTDQESQQRKERVTDCMKVSAGGNESFEDCCKKVVKQYPKFVTAYPSLWDYFRNRFKECPLPFDKLQRQIQDISNDLLVAVYKRFGVDQGPFSFGMITQKTIPKDAIITCFTGTISLVAELAPKNNYNELLSEKESLSVNASAGNKRGIAHLLNGCCADQEHPNVNMEWVWVKKGENDDKEGFPARIVYATREISPGSQLLAKYGELESGDSFWTYIKRCGGVRVCLHDENPLKAISLSDLIATKQNTSTS